MSASSRHHIPFPRNFLSLNAPAKKANDTVLVVSSPESEVPTHSFLSNQPHPRHSSVSSVDSSASTESSPATSESAVSPNREPTLPAFLPLNMKHVAPPTSADMVKSPFLSNRG